MSAKEAATEHCPSCGFSRLQPTDEEQPPTLAWRCSLPDANCRFIPRERPEPRRRPRGRKVDGQ